MLKNISFLIILFTHNNIFFNILDSKKKLIFQLSLGNQKVRGLKKTNINSIQNSLNIVYSILKNFNLNIHLKLKGLNKYKKVVLKNLKRYNLNILSINDEIIIVHNGCRNKKNRNF